MIKRELYLSKLRKFKDTEFIKVITGVRRSGKTFLLRMFQNELQETGIDAQQIISINFESMKYADINDATKLYTYVMKQAFTDKKMYLFFDEIQNVRNWEKAINSFRVDLDADIYVSGSNSSLLSGELATLLTGRLVTIHVYPLSFAEYIKFKGITDNYDRAFLEYVNEGGFPSVVLAQSKDVQRSVLEGIYSSILLRDVGTRATVRNNDVLVRMANYLLSEVGNQISPSKIMGVLKNEGYQGANNNSVNKYLELLEDAFLFYKARRYDLRGKAYLRSNAKYYAIDTGIRNATLNKNYQDNFGHQIENIVYIELLRRGYQVDIGKNNAEEIDFVASRGNNITYYQVTQQLPSADDREVGNLLNLSDNYKKVLITANRMDVGYDRGIPIIHIVDWLLEDLHDSDQKDYRYQVLQNFSETAYQRLTGDTELDRVPATIWKLWADPQADSIASLSRAIDSDDRRWKKLYNRLKNEFQSLD